MPNLVQTGPVTGRCRTIIADPDPAERRALRDALQNDAGFAVAAEARDGAEVVELARYYHPEVVLLEIDMPRLDGIEATRRISAMSPKVRPLIVARRDDEALQIEALRAGAWGFLTKGSDPRAVVQAVRAVAGGEAAISRRMTLKLAERLRTLPEAGTGMRPVASSLTPREWEVLDLLASGAGAADIAAELRLSKDTVRTHTKNVMRKLHVSDPAAAVVAARSLFQISA